MLTAEQRYHQARQKARMLSHRAVRDLMDGKIDCTIECQMDMEQRFIIEQLKRAFEDGRRSALTSG